MAFDMSMCDGSDITDLPLVMRKELFADVLAPSAGARKRVFENFRRRPPNDQGLLLLSAKHSTATTSVSPRRGLFGVILTVFLS